MRLIDTSPHGKPGATGPVKSVLVVAPQPFYEDRGTPIATRQLVTALGVLGFEVDLLTYPIGVSLEIPGVRVVRSPNPLRVREVPVGLSAAKIALDLPMCLELRRMLRAKTYCVVHALEELAFAAAWFDRHGASLLYDMQSSLPDQLRTHALFRPEVVQRALRGCERWLVQRADAIVCSAGLQGYVQTVSPQARVTEMIYLSASDAPDPALSEAFRRRCAIGDGQRIVLYSGTFEPYQGLDLLVEAMPQVLRAHPDVVFVMVGSTPMDHLADQPQARALVESGRLRVLPRQPRETLPSLLAAADVLVSSRSYGDNVPLKIFDYMGAGKPIVATDIKAHRALLDEHCAILVPVNAEGLAQGILRALAAPAAAALLGERAQVRSGRGAGAEPFHELVARVYGQVCELPSACAVPSPPNAGAVREPC